MSIAELPRGGALGDGVHRFPVRVYWEDTDAGGVVYHANYLKFAERARTEMLRALGIGQERLRGEAGVLLVVRRATIDFLGPARLDDDLVVESRVAALGGASLDLDQEVRRGALTLVHVKSRIACISAAGRPSRLPPELRAAFGSLRETLPGVLPHAS